MNLGTDFDRAVIESRLELSKRDLAFVKRLEKGKIRSFFSVLGKNEFYESLKVLNPTSYESFDRKIVLDKRKYSLTVSDLLTTKKYNVADCIYISKVKNFIRLTFRNQNDYENIIVDENNVILEFIEVNKSNNEKNLRVMKRFKRENFIFS